MITKQATIKNEAGIHCRPSALMIKAFSDYAGSIRVQAENGSCDLRSVLDLISLGLEHGTPVTISVEGPDEAQCCEKVVELIETKFDFPPA